MLFLVSLLVGASLVRAEPRVVDYVDLGRYLGVWYEVASIPQRFSQGCHCTKAIYGAKGPEELSVQNSCNKGSSQGELSKVNGSARVVDKITNAKLRVTFFWPFSGDYWIIGLDRDYRYAVVTNSDTSSLWILSRTRVLSEELTQEAFAIAANQGVDVGRALKTNQVGCSK